MGWDSGVIVEGGKSVLARGVYPEVQERHVRWEGALGCEEECFLGPRALIHAHIDAKSGLEGHESGMGQRTAENRREATESLPGNAMGTNA